MEVLMVPLSFEGTVDKCNVCFADLPAGKQFCEGRVGSVVLGYDDQSAGVFVEPMHDTGTEVAASG
jgi:hypothetical protein